MRDHRRALRLAGRAVVIIGLVLFWGSIVVSAAAALSLPEALWKAGTATVAAGCLWLVGVLAWPPGVGEKATPEAVLGYHHDLRPSRGRRPYHAGKTIETGCGAVAQYR